MLFDCTGRKARRAHVGDQIGGGIGVPMPLAIEMRVPIALDLMDKGRLDSDRDVLVGHDSAPPDHPGRFANHCPALFRADLVKQIVRHDQIEAFVCKP